MLRLSRSIPRQKQGAQEKDRGDREHFIHEQLNAFESLECLEKSKQSHGNRKERDGLVIKLFD